MSTTFGIKVPSQEEPIEIAFRGNSGYMKFTNPLAELLPSHLKVIPLDNDSRDIVTIGDIKAEINKLNINK